MLWNLTPTTVKIILLACTSDGVNNSDYKVANDWLTVSNKLEGTGEEAVLASPDVLFGQYPSETQKKGDPSQDSRRPNWIPPEEKVRHGIVSVNLLDEDHGHSRCSTAVTRLHGVTTHDNIK
jgi:hypothetical protein